jgi:hypothetical protein
MLETLYFYGELQPPQCCCRCNERGATNFGERYSVAQFDHYGISQHL